jgi:hypothetical protein
MVLLLTEGEEKKRRRGGEMAQAGGRPRIYTIDGGKGKGEGEGEGGWCSLG